ncbi:MAG: hypothetical protein JXR19_10170 [Bacteroidia bacterium]
MNKNNKIIWGVLSFLPLVVLVISFISVINHFTPYLIDAIHGEEILDPAELIPNIMYVWIALIVIGLISSVIWVVFLVFSIRDQSCTNDEQILWVLLLLFGNVIVLPIYWYFRLWNNPEFSFEQKLTDRTN